MENVVLVIFQDEKSTYQVLSDLKNRSGKSTVLQAGIVQNVGGSLVTKDGWVNAGSGDAWASGGLIGGLVGILGGPIGMLFGASVGMLVGSAVDVDDAFGAAGVIEKAAHELRDGYLALIVLADEPDTGELDAFFGHYGTSSIIRQDVATVQAEIYQAEEAARELKKQARAKMREEKKEEWKQKAAAVQAEVKQDVQRIKDKITS